MDWDYTLTIWRLPPSLNLIKGTRGKQMRGWREGKHLEVCLRDAMEREGCPPALGPRTLLFAYYFPDKRRRDKWNYEKLMTDACVRAGLLVDDNPQVCELDIELRYSGSDPRSVIYVREGLAKPSHSAPS